MSKISQKLENKKLKFYINYFSIQNQKKKKKNHCLNITLDIAWHCQLNMVTVESSVGTKIVH